MRRILHVTPYLDPSAGGPPVVVRRLHSLAGLSGWSARILTSPAYANDGGAALEAEPDVRVVSSQLASVWGQGRDQVREETMHADIVHCHTLWSPLVAVSAGIARRLRIPYVVSPHGMLDPYSLQKKSLKKSIYLRLFESNLLARASCVTFTTEAERDLATQSFGAVKRSRVIGLGADAPVQARDVLASGFFKKHPDLSGRPLIIFLGRLHEKKRPEAAIEAMRIVRKELPTATLLMVGTGDEKSVSALRALTIDTELSDAVRFTGFLEGEPKWQALAASSIFVLPSRQENFAIAAAEAMQAGLPVLLTASVNIWQEVVDAGAGQCIDDQDLVEDLAAQISALLRDSDRREEMSRQALALAERAYSWSACARATHDLYDDILRQHI